MESQKLRFLVYGKYGWIGGKIIELLKQQGYEVMGGEARLEEREKVLAEIESFKPDRIINCAGKTGRPNVDWCESHKQETIRCNVIGTLNLIDCAFTKDIHVTNMATGCIYEYDDEHKMNSGIGFTEEDEPNFKGSFYSYTKGLVEKFIVNYPNCLNLRLRMPISDDLHPRSFLTKILNYKKVINIPNSMSVLYDLLPLAIDMSIKKTTGLLNFVNPGTISHNEMLDMYKEYIDKDFTYTNFSLEELAKVTQSGRSNNELNTDKIKKMYPELKDIKTSMIELFKRMQQNNAKK